MNAGGRRVLIVEDKQDTIRGITTFLEYGFVSDIAENIEEAMSFCKDRHYDFLLLDWVVPENSNPISSPSSENGKVFLSNFKNMNKYFETPFIVYTAHNVIIKEKDTNFSGCMGVFNKTNMMDLMSVMRKALKPNIFIIHGHNELLLEKTKNHLLTIGLTPIVLADISDGATIIDSFERAAETCSAAIALITKDDEHLIKCGGTEWSGRHNVFLEIGWFIKHFTRDRTILVLEQGAQMPSDLAGIKYHSYKSSDKEVFSAITERLNTFHLINT
jgi:predicted nucleotide-binding protein